MNFFLRRLVFSGLLLLALAPVTGSAADKPQFSGFLEDYTGFEESPKISGAWRYIKPGAKLSDLKEVQQDHDRPYPGLGA